MSNEIALEVKNITKRFPGVLANDNINLDLKKGEIHALLGENGAGKSTLMNIIFGLYDPDEGEIFIDGKKVRIENPHDAIALGIGMVHQHFMLVPVFSVMENIILGSEVTRGPSLNYSKARKDILKISQEYGLEIDPDAIIEDLSVGVQQRVEIIKTLYRQANILVLDEPTSVLTPQEADDLFKIMRSLTDQGKSIIFITHKLREVLHVADRISVIRDGKIVGSTTPAKADKNILASMMVGRDVDLQVQKEKAKPGNVVLDVKNITVKDERHQDAVDGVSFKVRAGEILGVAGVQGNGQTELVEALSGLRHIANGTVILRGEEVTNDSPRKMIELGAGHIPEDRQKDGLVLAYSVSDNLILNRYYVEPFAKGVVLQEAAALESAEGLIEKYDIRTPSARTSVSSLSGGNQQKLIVAREFSRQTKLLIAAQPTRGLDVGSIEYIHSRLIEKRDEGNAVLLVSTELDEIMELSDRIAVMFDGKIVDILDADDTNKETIGLLMAGIHPDDTGK
ncbi:MAG: ABC transporter ATP-binding protein [Chloroflexi bacterium]|nr:ABC transporter ATP-binding protein [Chloroflexota bacterium]